MGFRVLVTDLVGPSLEAEKSVLDDIGAELVQAPNAGEATLASLAKGCDAIITNWAKTTRRVVDGALPGLRVISRTGIGVDNIDVAYATECGIPVTNIPAYCEADIAEQAMGLLLSVSRKIASMDRLVRQERWDRESGPPMQRLVGLTLGLIGLGKSARELAPRARAFGMNVIAHTPSLNAARASEVGARAVDLESLLRESDVISLHTPLNEQTRNLINADTLARMKPNAILINTSRGGVIDEDALYDALSSGRIAGAGLDVRVSEPVLPGDRLAQLDNVVSTPHAAYYSAVADLQRLTAWEVRRVLTGERPLNVVNPDFQRAGARTG